MKTKFLLAASFIFAVGMTSCSNSMDEENPNPSTKADNVLIVKLPENIKYTRAVEETVAGNETTVDDIAVFLLAGESVERVETLSEAEITKGEKRFEQIPSQVDNVIVVANIHDMNIKDLKNANAILKDFKYDVLSQHKKAKLGGKTLMGRANATVLSETETEVAPVDGHQYKQANVTLKSITGRIEVGAVVPGEGVETVELSSIYVNNFNEYHPGISPVLYNEDHKFWGVNITGNNPGANIGSENPIGTITIKMTPEDTYQPIVYHTYGSTDVTTTGNKAYAFHVFPNSLPHIVMLVKVELKEGYYEVKDGKELKYKYGFVTFSKYKDVSGYIQSMEAHKIYKMGVGTGGIPINAKDITDKPEKGPYDLGVKIEIADWDIHNVTPEV
ncbi:hypothetical protein [Bacteroides sp. 224]|uniref:hypothetical protein n=1 Tax=Bacteroides sp. 224 TaxID=2302936 RepID=UPI0013D52216|nr:hypothetical protein [Bacteroides sp. 224]NDV66885.1 hypothetical protein [Bacteroides sp. 224]